MKAKEIQKSVFFMQHRCNMQHITNAYVCLKFNLILKIHVVQAKMVIMMMLLDIGLLS